MSSSEPEGDIVNGPPALHPNVGTANIQINGSYVTLKHLHPEDTPQLFELLGGTENDHLYKYLPDGPLPDLESFTKHMDFLRKGPVLFPFTIFLHPPSQEKGKESIPESSLGKPVGIICFLNIVPHHRSIEVGHVLFSTTLQRTTAATESIFLLMRYAFEELNYLRVEWKANILNMPSKRAALRLGYVAEGVFRKHMIIKGRRRDSAWFSVTDDEWFKPGKGGVRDALVKWLQDDNFDSDGRQKMKLEEIRDLDY